MQKKITVAAVQMAITTNEIQTNLGTIERITRQIFEKGEPDLIVFPEDCITGPIPDRLDLVQDEDSESIKLFRKLAGEFDTFIVTGSFIKKSGDKFFNTSLLINNHGEIVLEYQKINLWPSERRYLTAGSEPKCVETEIGKIGIIICWDMADPSICRELAKQGAEIICCPSYWTQDKTGILAKHLAENEKMFVNTICPARAMENEVLFVFANGAGEARYFQSEKLHLSQQIGQSQICAPIIGTAVKINDNSEGFVSYTYDKQIGEDAERIFKIRADLY